MYKIGELQSQSLQQPTGHWIVVRWITQAEPCKKKEIKKKYKDALRMARNKLSILQC